MRVDDTVAALITAVLLAAALISAAPLPGGGGGYAIGVAGVGGGTVTVYVANMFTTPALLAVRGRLEGGASYSTTVLLPPGSNTTFTLNTGSSAGGWLVLRLYAYNATLHAWLYTGRWVRVRLGPGW